MAAEAMEETRKDGPKSPEVPAELGRGPLDILECGIRPI